jgi:hypothetical protein
VNLRKGGLSSVSISNYIWAMNAYWRWGDTRLKIAYLKEEEKIFATLTAEQIRRLVSFTPKGNNGYAPIRLVADSGWELLDH